MMNTSDRPAPPLDELSRLELALLTPVVSHLLLNAHAAALSQLEVLELSRRNDLPPAVVQTNRAVIERLVSTAKTARALSELAQDQSPITRAPLDCDAFLETCIERFRQEHLEADAIDWSLNIASHTVLNADRQMLDLMMQHLLQNACEAALEPLHAAQLARRPSIEIRAAREASRWELSIENSGAILAPEVAARAFEPFFTTKTGHRGVGLALARRVWRLHAGGMELRARQDGGASVTAHVTVHKNSPAD